MSARHVLAIASALTAVAPAMAADPAALKWDSIPAKEVTLLYPGQSSMEWMVSAGHKAGAAGVRANKGCGECHAGEEKEIGDAIAAGKKLEPHVLPNKPGTLTVTMQAAFDAEYLYLRAVFPTATPGLAYPYYRFQDGKWVSFGDHRGEAAVAEGKQPPIYEDRFSVMISDAKSVPEFRTAGCWATCHNDMRYMPQHPKKEELAAHPVLGAQGQKRGDIRKYIAQSRTAMGDSGGWDKPRSKDEIDALRAKGVFLDLWQWRSHRSNPVNKADDGYVLEYRLFDAGSNPFLANWDADKKQPKFMFDPAKNQGRAAVAEADLRKANLLLPDNRAPFDSSRGWKNGDLLPKWTLNPQSTGSAADNDAWGRYAEGRWTVLLRRKLDTGSPRDDLPLKAGETYVIGLAAHTDNTTARWHYVSFPMTFGIGTGKGDVNAVAIR